MITEENIKALVKKYCDLNETCVKTSTEMDNKVIDDAFMAYEESRAKSVRTAMAQRCDISNNVQRATELFSEFGDFIRSVISHKVHNQNLADDLFQGFFLSLVSKPIPAGVQNVKSYLYRAIINDIVDATLRVEKYKTRMNKYAKCLNYSVNTNSPENALIEAEEMDKMFKLIEGRLRRSEVQAISLRYRNSYNIKEVAKKMHVDNRTVSRYIAVGLHKAWQFLAFEQEAHK